MVFQRVEAFSDFSRSVMRHMKRGVVTNFFLTPDEIKAEISEGRISTLEEGDSLLILRERDGFSILGFYIDSPEVFIMPKRALHEASATVVCEAVKENASFILERAGGARCLTRVKLELESVSCAATVDSDVIRKVSERDAEKAYAVLSENLPKLTGCIPLESTLEKECAEGLVFGAYLDGKLVGVLREGVKKTSAEIKHLAVADGCRGKHLGNALVTAFLAENGGNKCHVITSCDNTPAIKLYEKNGFRLVGEISRVFRFDKITERI